MLSKKNLLQREEYRNLTSRKIKPIQGRFFGLVYDPKGEGSRFGVIVSNKVLTKAVWRNQTKRRLYHAIKKTLLNQKGHFLFLAKRNSLEANPIDLNKELADFKSKLITIE